MTPATSTAGKAGEARGACVTSATSYFGARICRFCCLPLVRNGSSRRIHHRMRFATRSGLSEPRLPRQRVLSAALLQLGTRETRRLRAVPPHDRDPDRRVAGVGRKAVR